MKKTVRIKLEKLVISKEDLLRFSGFFEETYSRSKTGRANYSYVFECDDEKISYQLDNKKLKEQKDFLDINKIRKILMYYNDYSVGKHIYLKISHGSNYCNEISISWNDVGWVDKTFAKFENIKSAIKIQNNFFLRYKNLFFHISGLIIGLSIIFILSFIILSLPISVEDVDNQNLFVVLLKEFLIIRLLSILLFSWLSWINFLFITGIFKKLSDLRPNIEFDFWPQHLKKEQKNRKVWWFILTMFLIPIVLQILFWLFFSGYLNKYLF